MKYIVRSLHNAYMENLVRALGLLTAYMKQRKCVIYCILEIYSKGIIYTFLHKCNVVRALSDSNRKLQVTLRASEMRMNVSSGEKITKV